ncbi:MAG: 4-hydroxy-3-methylbut-2-enyl diphosphate reductase, partial [Spirochaetales bacterium]|nr:4-hydroxy-3-methylbut-2-enyl diphosphate reductase [Spirochaetales bacterium]
MVIVKAAVMGFCAGVRSAVNLVEQAIETGREQGVPVYTIGSLIHNEQYLELLHERGVHVIHRPDEAEPGVAVVRAHGIPRKLYLEFEKAGFLLVDGTCPRVIRSQKTVREYSQKGWHIILAGDP